MGAVAPFVGSIAVDLIQNICVILTLQSIVAYRLSQATLIRRHNQTPRTTKMTPKSVNSVVPQIALTLRNSHSSIDERSSVGSHAGVVGVGQALLTSKGNVLGSEGKTVGIGCVFLGAEILCTFAPIVRKRAAYLPQIDDVPHL